MLKTDINIIGLVFSVNIDGNDIEFNEWQQTNDIIYYTPLSTLVDNGCAFVEDKRCVVPFESVYLIDDDDKVLLGIPEYYDKAIRLCSDSMLNRDDFYYKLEFLTYVPDGILLTCKRIGNIVHTGNRQYLLNKKQYLLAHAIDMYNSTAFTKKTPDFNMKQFANIKELAIDADCELDSYLQNENVHAPEKIKIELGRDEEGFTIDPAIDIEENENFKRTFNKMRKVQGVYPLQKENGERVRLVLDQEQKSNLEKLKQSGSRHKTHEEILDIVERPTEYFNPDSFDLSELYSDRVIEIGIYKPKFYPFISAYKSCWITGATIETPKNGTCKVHINDNSKLDELKSAINEAISKKSPVIVYENNHINIEDAKFLAQIAEKQLSNPRIPVDTTQIDNQKKVLIIKDNAEELKFSTAEPDLSANNQYTLFKNPYLQKGFSLKTHQEEGVAWLQYLHNNKASGCLMADDMGLGKTLQILYFIDWHSRMNPNHKPYLIVAPISLLENWENEYNRFFMSPRMEITRLSSKEVPRHFDKDIIHKMQRMDIILTNYESLRNSQLNFCAVEFDIVAVDEAQKIKSPGTLVTNAAKAIKSNFKIAMTGTPVENTLLDLWCIMDFCVPGLLGNAKSFAAKYQNPLKKEDSDIVALGNEVHEKLGCYFMRRLKKDAAKDLPMKLEYKQHISMPKIQEDVYNNVVKAYTEGLETSMLVTINQMRAVSEHPYLWNDTLFEHDSEELKETSARLMATIVILDQIQAKNEKVIVFAERKDTQKMLQQICRHRYKILPKIINGDTPTHVANIDNGKLSRQAAINKFQSEQGFNIIIMSPIAAGMGLNVTAANHVIHYSRHWNPAKENQATDRAYRIGQEKDVYVYYPMAVSPNFKSFDETLDELLSRKTNLATSTIFPTERIEVRQDELGSMLFRES